MLIAHLFAMQQGISGVHHVTTISFMPTYAIFLAITAPFSPTNQIERVMEKCRNRLQI